MNVVKRYQHGGLNSSNVVRGASPYKQVQQKYTKLEQSYETRICGKPVPWYHFVRWCSKSSQESCIYISLKKLEHFHPI